MHPSFHSYHRIFQVALHLVIVIVDVKELCLQHHKSSYLRCNHLFRLHDSYLISYFLKEISQKRLRNDFLCDYLFFSGLKKSEHHLCSTNAEFFPFIGLRE